MIDSRDLAIGSARVRPPSIVIPAKAGIHFDFHAMQHCRSKMDPGFRRDDGMEL
jgi:hypothetical protein